ncbi:MAG: hypothetical protein CBD58_04450 [bacterium TMED198]|nr:MAG: hypothetical protein CBD58_04450 [bacterium TMED198]|tara:strand:+ start:8217 stop:8909 length:693 start_codon:yes stop_codon:yes gene_type:complete
MKNFILILLLVISCDNHLIEPYDLVTLGVVGTGNSNFQIIDSHSYDDWQYFSIGPYADTLISVEVDSRCDDVTWDIAFNRNHIRTNGGTSGSACGGAYINRDKTWNEENFSQFSFEQSSYSSESINFHFDTSINSVYQGLGNFGSTCASLELEDWGSFDSNYTLIPTNFQFFVRSSNGEKIIAMWIPSYYGTGSSGGYPLVNYIIFDNEDLEFNCLNQLQCKTDQECQAL